MTNTDEPFVVAGSRTRTGWVVVHHDGTGWNTSEDRPATTTEIETVNADVDAGAPHATRMPQVEKFADAHTRLHNMLRVATRTAHEYRAHIRDVYLEMADDLYRGIHALARDVDPEGVLADIARAWGETADHADPDVASILRKWAAQVGPF